MARTVFRAARTLLLPGLAATTLALYAYASLYETTYFDRAVAEGAVGDEAVAAARKARHYSQVDRRPYLAVGNYVTEFALSGFGYLDGDRRRLVRSSITWSVVASLSPSVEGEAHDMFQDSYGDSGMHALGGGLIRHPSSANRLLVAHRLWLDNYYEKKRALRAGSVERFDVFVSFRNSWHENYLLYAEVDDDYHPLTVSRMLEIPTPTNLEFYEESDGPMDPKFVDVSGDLYLTFYTWARQRTGRSSGGDTVAGRTHVWDMQRKVKINLRLADGVEELRVSETGWAPLAKNGSLYFVRSFEPLRVVRCRLPSGDCHSESSSDRRNRGGVPSAAAAAITPPPESASGTALVEYSYPYYVGILHEPLTADQASPSARLAAHLLAPRLVVLCTEPWRVAYVSEPLPANGSWLHSVSVVRRPPPSPFWHPTAVLLRDDDTLDVSAQLNDYGAYVVRLRGLRRLLGNVLSLSAGP